MQKDKARLFESRAYLLHGGFYSYGKAIYTNSKEPIIVTCPVHGDFSTTPNYHLNGRGCPQCWELRRGAANSLGKEGYLNRFRNRHGNRYDYSACNPTTMFEKCIIKCRKHGAFMQVAKDHISGCGCTSCYNESKAVNQEEWINRFKAVHCETYKYCDFIYTGSKKRAVIHCCHHGPFEQTPQSHANGAGCPNCKCGNISRAEIRFMDAIGVEMRQVSIYHPDRMRPFKVDGYDPATNTIYEFDGDFFHGNPELYDPDEINPLTKTTFRELYNQTLEKTRALEELGYKVVRVWESSSEKYIESRRKGFEDPSPLPHCRQANISAS